MPGPGLSDAKLEEMKDKVTRQREQLDLLKSQVQTLLQRKGSKEEIRVEVEATGSKSVASGRPELRKSFTLMEHKLHVAFYEFDQSMWDASLLLCFHRTTWIDKLLLFVGVSLNLTLQVALLLVVSMNMLDNPFPDEKVQEMIEWRVRNGHAQFDSDTGKSLISRLCNRELWSYEQDEYDEMYEYLYMPVPGVILSALAIVLWVLTIMVEYRHCIEQYLGVYHLPSLNAKDEFVEISDEGEIEIKGIPWYYRYIALLFLCLPRLFVMGFLGIVGCQYLAQTASLSDIVLNAVALAFVLEVDELVANVLLTEKLRGLLPKIKPISCGTTSHNFTPVKDIMRYLITAGLIGFSFVYWLLPFSNNVEAAAMALCGGYQDFSFTGGIASDPGVVLRPRDYGTDLWIEDCVGPSEEAYYQKYYVQGGSKNTTSNATTASIDYEGRRQKRVLEFAFNRFFAPDCKDGEMLQPQSENGDRPCIPIPASLLRTLPDGVTAGLSSAGLPPDCPRLNISSGCAQPNLGEFCVWSWLSAKCDGDLPPGNLFHTGCAADSAYTDKCQIFKGEFDVQHPQVNCRAWEVCAQEACIGMSGMLSLYINDITNLPDDSYDFESKLWDTFSTLSGGLLHRDLGNVRRLQSGYYQPAFLNMQYPSGLYTFLDLKNYYQFTEPWSPSVALNYSFWFPSLPATFYSAQFLAAANGSGFTDTFNAAWFAFDNTSSFNLTSHRLDSTVLAVQEFVDNQNGGGDGDGDGDGPGGDGDGDGPGDYGDGPGGDGPGTYGDGDGPGYGNPGGDGPGGDGYGDGPGGDLGGDGPGGDGGDLGGDGPGGDGPGGDGGYGNY